jgi:hypothetical protein
MAFVQVVEGGTGPVAVDRGGAFCLPRFFDTSRVHLLVTAVGYQDQVSPPIDVGPALNPRVDITLTRQFSERITVTGRADSLVGISASASEGSIGIAELASRPLLRSTDIIEAIPGVVMTQHSTGGHAPIILLRGYNLDHGTDFATFVDGVPLNLPSHAHAQGYTDTNFLIPELIGRIDFQKGPYAAAVGDFGTAGSANIELPDTLPESFAAVAGGEHNFFHGVAGGSAVRGSGRWLFGAEASHYDGPSVVPDDFNRLKGVLQFSSGDAMRGYRVSAFSYAAKWNATDGYPERALDHGLITRFGTLDPSDGGRTARHLVIARRQTSTDRALTRVVGYAQYYDFDLFSNLTFFTRDATLGDQIQQSERRFTSGLMASRKWFLSWRGRSVEATGGGQTRTDVVHLHLRNTYQRRPVDKRDDTGKLIPALGYDSRVVETSISPYVETQVRWGSWLRSVVGLRADLFHAVVDGTDHASSGRPTAGLVSPKGALVFGPWRHTEAYANAGYGFHSNHANGTTLSSDLLVRTRAAEVGVRTLAIANLQSSVSVWVIDSDSELVYVPEEGFTQPERPGRRYGVEWNNFYRVRPWLVVDADAAWSRARYRIDPLDEGVEIPDAIQGVFSAGVTIRNVGPLSGSLRGRYLGRRPLVSDGSVFSRPSLVCNGQLEAQLGARFSIGVDVFNIFDRRYEDIAYYFPTRIRDPRAGGALEPAEQPDFVTHPGEPRSARIRLRARL